MCSRHLPVIGSVTTSVGLLYFPSAENVIFVCGYIRYDKWWSLGQYQWWCKLIHITISPNHESYVNDQ